MCYSQPYDQEYIIDPLEAEFVGTPLCDCLFACLEHRSPETAAALLRELQVVIEDPDADREIVSICQEAIEYFYLAS